MAGSRATALWVLLGIVVWANEGDGTGPSRRPVDAADVARYPAPGTVVPGSFRFSKDGRSLTYLLSEANGSGRVLWNVGVSGGVPSVIARPEGAGNTDANVSPEESLRRERMRVRDTGITQVVWAEKADVAVIPLNNDLYLLNGPGPLKRLTETPSPEIDPRLNPDGTKVAFVRDNELHVLDLASRAETHVTEGAGPGISHAVAEYIAQEEMDRFAGFWWSSDGASIAYQETDEKPVPLYPIVHQGGASWSVETHRYPFAGKANARVRLGVIPASGGTTRWLDLTDGGQDVYLARVHWESPSSLLVQVLSRDQKALRLVRFDAATGSRKTLIEDVAKPAWVNLHNDLRTLERSGEVLWSSERTGFRHLELHDRSGKLVRVLTSGEWPVDEVLAVDEPRREVWFSSGREHPCGQQVFRVSLDGGGVERVTTEPGTHKVVVSKDGNTFVDVFSDLERAPVTTLRGRSGEARITLHDARNDPRLAEIRIVPPVLTEYKNRDGVTLFGAYYAPRSRPGGGRAPLVVMVYGGPHVQRVTDSWATTADMTAQYLSERGFAVWKTDNRGSSRRGLAFESALNRDLGTVEVRDQVDGVGFVARSWPEVDTSRVGVTGGSYGGYMTLRCMALAPDVFKAGVAVAPVTDWDGYDTCYTERYMGTPADNPEGYKAASVLVQADKLIGPLLLVHGLLDENVHYRHTARLTNALIAAGRGFEILPLPDSRHGQRREADRKYLAERTAAFFQKSLAPSP